MSCTMRWRTTSFAHAHEGQPVDARQHALEAGHAAAPGVGGQVDLGHVGGHDHRDPTMRVRNIFICSGVAFCASSRMMKLWLSVRPRARRRRRDLDGAALEQPLGALGLDHVVERVVERAQVGVDLGGQVAQEEPGARPPRRPGGSG